MCQIPCLWTVANIRITKSKSLFTLFTAQINLETYGLHLTLGILNAYNLRKTRINNNGDKSSII